MTSRNPPIGSRPLFDLDPKRTERPGSQEGIFYWDEDIFVYTGQRKFIMSKALSLLPSSIRSSFKQNLISFFTNGNYGSNSCTGIIGAILASLNAHPTRAFNTSWIAKALTRSSFLRNKKAITIFFLHWKEHDSEVISQNALNLLNDTAPFRNGPRNILSDDPNKSWLTNSEYDSLLRAVWHNYDINAAGTQVTLMRLLSMQYARRPIQIAHLKIGDIFDNDGSDHFAPTGKVIRFPGAKDKGSEIGFRDSKFEHHVLADHLWHLCSVQRQEVKALYEYMMGFSPTEDQLLKLPIFCSELRIKQALEIIIDKRQDSLFDNLNSDLFHIKKTQVTHILCWITNSPTCDYGAANQKLLTSRPPISPRTGHPMVISATRMRHTRARQLARMGIPNHMLSHWLGHTSERSLAAYYNDPAEQARQLDEAMAPALAPFAMAFAGTLIDSEDQATRASDQTSKLEFARVGELKSVGHCGKFSFCATTSVPIPCYRCKYFEPLVDAPHHEVLDALERRQAAEEQVLKIGSPRNLLIPINLSADICAVKNCIELCNARKAKREINP
ncbi:site-specific integrase [Pseudomonas sp. R62]|uniref:site-specific integrase n=1 Tax=Pseudomonas sp. R62 TaxID=1144884 RepID=UPI0002D3E554|nr:site-specific integrase [Pseudomonas sp. R62]